MRKTLPFWMIGLLSPALSMAPSMIKPIRKVKAETISMPTTTASTCLKNVFIRFYWIELMSIGMGWGGFGEAGVAKQS